MTIGRLASLCALVLVTVWGLPSHAASYQMIDLVEANHRLSDMTNGTNYPGPGDYTAFDGIPYRVGAPNVDGYDIWHSAEVAGSTQTYVLPVNVFGVTEVYTVMNIWWGQADHQVATVEFFGSGGANFSKTLVVGTDIRDHAIPGFVATINGTSTMQVFVDAGNTVRLDRQMFVLPADFTTQTLTSIKITNLTDPANDGLGQAFIVAATVAAVPEPGSYALMLAGLVFLGLGARRSRY